MKRNIGIYSGTFDPIHNGHITFAERSLVECNLDKVFLLPEPNPRKKHGVTDIVHRLELVRKAIVSSPNLAVISTESKQFDVKETLPQLKVLFPDASLTFLFGSDLIKGFLTGWANLDNLLGSASLSIGMRQGDSEQEITAVLNQLQTLYSIPISYTLIYTDNESLASSKIRQGFKNISHLPSGVNEYIVDNKLY